MEETARCMNALNTLGPQFSLDDFGTGYSAFAHMQQLPIAALKVDKSFIDRVVQNDDDAIIVGAMINLAHSLGLSIIAEGAETRDQVQFLKERQCDQVQGYYFSTPLQFDRFTALISGDVKVAI